MDQAEAAAPGATGGIGMDQAEAAGPGATGGLDQAEAAAPVPGATGGTVSASARCGARLRRCKTGWPCQHRRDGEPKQIPLRRLKTCNAVKNTLIHASGCRLASAPTQKLKPSGPYAMGAPVAVGSDRAAAAVAAPDEDCGTDCGFVTAMLCSAPMERRGNT
jgi:hypothetical protein